MKKGLVLEHRQFILDANLKNYLPVNFKKFTKMFIKKLLKSLEMKELGLLKIYGAKDARAPGFTFLQPITTSHISGHYFSKPGQSPHIHLDIYSCKSFSWKTVILLAHQFFVLGDWNANYINRSLSKKRSYLSIKGSGAKCSIFEKLT
jgi:hypothetical protein